MKPYEINALLKLYNLLPDEHLDCYTEAGRFYIRMTKDVKGHLITSCKQFFPTRDNLKQIDKDVREVAADLAMKVFDSRNGKTVFESNPPFEVCERINAA